MAEERYTGIKVLDEILEYLITIKEKYGVKEMQLLDFAEVMAKDYFFRNGDKSYNTMLRYRKFINLLNDILFNEKTDRALLKLK